MKTSLRIVIVNWNSGDQLKNCIESINTAENDCFYVSEIVVVDNGSIDGSMSGIFNKKIKIIIINNQKNVGFAAACNQGALYNSSDYILFLNPDVLLFKNSLNNPILFMENKKNSDVGICGINLVDEFNRETISAANFPTLRIFIGYSFGLAKIAPKLFPPHFLVRPPDVNCNVVDQVMGAFFLVRKHVFDLCKGFDERFFVYFEEVDFALRAKKNGFNSYLLPQATAFHKGGGCSGSIKDTRLFYVLRSRIIYAEKHFSKFDYYTLILITAVEFPIRIVVSVFKFSFLDIKNTFSAYMQLIKYFI